MSYAESPVDKLRPTISSDHRVHDSRCSCQEGKYSNDAKATND